MSKSLKYGTIGNSLGKLTLINYLASSTTKKYSLSKINRNDLLHTYLMTYYK